MSMHLGNLNPEQQKAVYHTDGPLLILAGAGAGKTKTLTHRILNLIQNGIAPHNILAITFTNKAAREMRERVFGLIKESSTINTPITSNERPFVSTFHSLGVHILKEQAHLLGMPRHFTIFDKNNSQSAIKEALKKLDLDPKQFNPNKIQNIISREKGRGKRQSEYAAEVGNEYLPEIVNNVWELYQKTLKSEGAFDFDDLLLETAKLLESNTEIRTYYQNTWQHIHIDEYQDTNGVQYNIAKLLVGEKHNICAVGDIDQNIYSWRGAELKNILNFEKDYPRAEIILLEQNYRSTQNILTVANEIIKKNTFRRDKNLFTKNEEGEKLGLYTALDETDEATFIATRSEALLKSGIPADEIAVLYRANFQSRALEEAFLKCDVPYQLLGTKFFDRKEVKDVLSYLRAALNPDSLSDIKRAIATPRRGVGKITLLKIFEKKIGELPGATRSKVEHFFTTLKKIKAYALSHKPSETIIFILKESGIEDEFARSKSDEDKERLENARELVSLATKYDEFEVGEGIEKLIEEAALATDQDELDKPREGIKLMTVHASKGLEFDYVFIVGLEDGLFPHERLDGNNHATEESEEERRLFYVALTRARKKVILTYAGLRTIYGSKQVNTMSEFICDIDDIYLEEENPTNEKADDDFFFRIDF